jgi:hypothetical protein
VIIYNSESIHDYQANYDAVRTGEDYGYHVIRFRNEMVLNDIEGVLNQIKAIALERITDLSPNLTPDPSPNSRRGESTLTPDPNESGKTVKTVRHC